MPQAPPDTPPTGADPAGSIPRRVAFGVALMILAPTAARVFSVISTLFLVRLLAPKDFGLIGLAGAAIATPDTLTTTNYAMAVIRRSDADTTVDDTAWTLDVLRCLLLAALLAATAEAQARLLGDPRVGPIVL